MIDVLLEWEVLGRELCLCERAPNSGAWTRLPETEARWALSALLRDPGKLAALRAVLVRRSGGIHRPDTSDGSVLEADIARGVLAVYARPVERTALRSVIERPEPEKAPRAELRMQRARVDIIVVDDGEPVRPFAGLGYRLTLPDRSVEEGVLAGGGQVRVENIEAGNCRLELADVRRVLAP